MTFHRFLPLFVGVSCALTTASCGWISETGPIKRNIEAENPDFQLIHVRSAADIPKVGRVYGSASTPPRVRGEPYSDKVRPRDVLNIVITDPAAESPFYSKGNAFNFGPVEVPENGELQVPFLGSIHVSGRSLSQVSAELSEKAKPVSNGAQVSVVRSKRMPRTASVIGEVKNPGLFPLERSQIDSSELLAAAGGPKDSDYLFKYNLRRNGKEYPFDYLGFRQHPFRVEEGDQLTVISDTENRFHVMGAINKPVTVPFPIPAPTLADALGAASGLDERRSDPSGVFVFRRGNPALVYTFDLKNPASIQLIQRFPIVGNDIVYVTEAPLTRWNRLISQLLPVTISQAANSASRYSGN
jgi:polysaccharide export outer membrane protein